MTLQAQNALLKVFEEPRAGVRFILVTTGKNSIIPTLLSRLQHRDLDIGTKDVTENKEENFAKEFLKSTSSERMKIKEVTSLLARKDEEDRKDREKVQESIYAIATELKKSNTAPHYIEKTLVMASYSGDPSSSGKSILEYLSLLLPVIK
jgi:DNA polymerase-3 subunit delta'